MATHSDILAWRNPMDRGAWWATVHGVASVGHDLASNHHKNENQNGALHSGNWRGGFLTEMGSQRVSKSLTKFCGLSWVVVCSCFVTIYSLSYILLKHYMYMCI